MRILTRRTAAQRTAIRRAYSFLYREPLLNCFRHRLSRHCLLASVDFWVPFRDANGIRLKVSFLVQFSNFE